MFDLGIEETKRKLRNLLGMMAWKKHIRKIAGYNHADMPTTFMLNLADMEKPGEFWKEYEQEILPELIEETKNNEWHITEQVQGVSSISHYG